MTQSPINLSVMSTKEFAVGLIFVMVSD